MDTKHDAFAMSPRPSTEYSEIHAMSPGDDDSFPAFAFAPMPSAGSDAPWVMPLQVRTSRWNSSPRCTYRSNQ